MSSYSATIQYAVHTEAPEFPEVLNWIFEHKLKHEVHLARTRFWVPRNSPLHSEFALKYYHCTSEVKE
jgi:hypothetical protein